MIKKKASDYDIAAEIQDSDLFLISQSSAGEYITKNVTGNTIKAYTLDGFNSFDANTALHEGTTTGHLSGTTTVKEMADKVDALTTTYTTSTPFNYMMLTRGFTTTDPIGWTSQQLTFSPITALTSYGGFVSSDTSSLRSCISYIEMWIPPDATNFRPSGCINFSILTSEAATTNNKIDVSIYQSTSGYGSPTLLKTLTGLTSTNSTTPYLVTLNKFGYGSGVELVSAFGGSILTFKFTFYSFNSKFSALLSGNINYTCG